MQLNETEKKLIQDYRNIAAQDQGLITRVAEQAANIAPLYEEMRAEGIDPRNPEHFDQVFNYRDNRKS